MRWAVLTQGVTRVGGVDGLGNASLVLACSLSSSGGSDVEKGQKKKGKIRTGLSNLDGFEDRGMLNFGSFWEWRYGEYGSAERAGR